MDRWQAMHVFIRVVDAGSFAGAARTLNMSPAAVTRIVARLEDLIGARLFVRTTRVVRLTEAGQRYDADCRKILMDIAEAEANAAGSFKQPAGNLTITAPILFGRIYILPILMDFLDLYPGVSVRTVFVDQVSNLLEDGMDVAIRIGHLPDSGLSARRVGAVRRVVCGAPAYFAAHGIPRFPADLADHRIIGRRGAMASDDWSFGTDDRTRVTIHSRLVCNTNDAAIAAAVAGWGVASVLSYQVAHEVRSGALQTVLEDFDAAPIPIHIVHAEGRTASGRVRAFVDFTAERLLANLLINR